MAEKRRLIASTKSKKQDQHKLSLDTMMSNTQCSIKEKRVPKCPSMLIDDFIELERSKDKATSSKSLNGETPGSCHPSSNQAPKVNQNLLTPRRNREERQEEVIEDLAQVEGDINEEEEETNTIRQEEKEGEGN